MRRHLQPLVAQLDRARVAFALNVTSLPSYYAHVNRYFGPLPDGAWAVSTLLTSRIVPRAFMLAPASRAALTALQRTAVADTGLVVSNFALKAPLAARVADNAVHPAWRSALALTLLSRNVDGGADAGATVRAIQAQLTNIYEPRLRALLPQSAPYVNEANDALPDVVEASYGPNLSRLRAVKRVYDPDDLFFAPYGVGSGAWKADADGRLCRALA